MSIPELNSLANIDSLNPFPQSKISVGVGNTIVSMAFFGVGPSVVAYAVLKVLEDNEKVKDLIPFSQPVTLPITAFLLNRIFNMPAIGLIALGGVYLGMRYLMNHQYPNQASVVLNKCGFTSPLISSLMCDVSNLFSTLIHRTRYSIKDMGSVKLYTIQLPMGVDKVSRERGVIPLEQCQRLLDYERQQRCCELIHRVYPRSHSRSSCVITVAERNDGVLFLQHSLFRGSQVCCGVI